MTDRELVQISSNLAWSFDQIQKIHDNLPDKFQTEEYVVEAAKFLTSVAASAFDITVLPGDDQPTIVYQGPPLLK